MVRSEAGCSESEITGFFPTMVVAAAWMFVRLPTEMFSARSTVTPRSTEPIASLNRTSPSAVPIEAAVPNPDCEAIAMRVSAFAPSVAIRQVSLLMP